MKSTAHRSHGWVSHDLNEPRSQQILTHALNNDKTSFAICTAVRMHVRELIDFIEHIDAGNVAPVAFDDVDELVDGGVAAHEDVCRGDAVFAADAVGDFRCEDRLRAHCLEVDGTALFASVGGSRERKERASLRTKLLNVETIETIETELRGSNATREQEISKNMSIQRT